MPSLEDTLAIHELITKYSHVVDGRAWADLDALFTKDGIFDASSVGYPVVEGMLALRHHMETADHPIAHIVTNIVLRDIDRDTVAAASMVLTPTQDGLMAPGDYRDIIVRTAVGWRFRKRAAIARYQGAAVPRPPDTW